MILIAGTLVAIYVTIIVCTFIFFLRRQAAKDHLATQAFARIGDENELNGNLPDLKGRDTSLDKAWIALFEGKIGDEQAFSSIRGYIANSPQAATDWGKLSLLFQGNQKVEIVELWKTALESCPNDFRVWQNATDCTASFSGSDALAINVGCIERYPLVPRNLVSAANRLRWLKTDSLRSFDYFLERSKIRWSDADGVAAELMRNKLKIVPISFARLLLAVKVRVLNQRVSPVYIAYALEAAADQDNRSMIQDLIRTIHSEISREQIRLLQEPERFAINSALVRAGIVLQQSELVRQAMSDIISGIESEHQSYNEKLVRSLLHAGYQPLAADYVLSLKALFPQINLEGDVEEAVLGHAIKPK